MRMRDWRSDVCSSDLEPPSFSLPAASGRLLEVRQQRHHPRRQAMKQKADFIITGRIGKIDAKEKVAHIDVATKYPYKDKDDNWKDRTVWNRVTLFKKQHERVPEIGVGDLVTFEGRSEENTS